MEDIQGNSGKHKHLRQEHLPLGVSTAHTEGDWRPLRLGWGRHALNSHNEDVSQKQEGITEGLFGVWRQVLR